MINRDRDWDALSNGQEIHLGDYLNGVYSRIEKQDTQNFTGHASTSGGYLFCKNSEVTLIPDSGNTYFVTFVGGGCKGNGKLKYQGDTLKGKVNFVEWPGLTAKLTKSE